MIKPVFWSCKVQSRSENRSYFSVFTLSILCFSFLLTICVRAMETEEYCSEKGRKNTDQFQGELRETIIWSNVYSQVSSVTFLWLHWWDSAFSFFTFTVCICVLNCASPLTTSWLMNIEWWHFFGSGGFSVSTARKLKSGSVSAVMLLDAALLMKRAFGLG